MNKNWDIIVKFHDCPNYYIDKGHRYCVHEHGSQYCSEAECPIKQLFNDANRPDSRCVTDDEANICRLVSEVNELREKVKAAENCLVCSAIADPMEVIQNTLVILKTKNNSKFNTGECYNGEDMVEMSGDDQMKRDVRILCEKIMGTAWDCLTKEEWKNIESRAFEIGHWSQIINA